MVFLDRFWFPPAGFKHTNRTDTFPGTLREIKGRIVSSIENDNEIVVVEDLDTLTDGHMRAQEFLLAFYKYVGGKEMHSYAEDFFNDYPIQYGGFD